MATPQSLSFGRDIQGYNAYAPVPSNNKQSVSIASAGHATFTVPSTSQTWIVNFSFTPGSEFWVAYDGATAAPPAGSTFASTTSEMLPAQRFLKSGSVVDVYNNGTATASVGVVMYASKE